jgi:hypothetical protein
MKAITMQIQIQPKLRLGAIFAGLCLTSVAAAQFAPVEPFKGTSRESWEGRKAGFLGVAPDRASAFKIMHGAARIYTSDVSGEFGIYRPPGSFVYIPSTSCLGCGPLCAATSALCTSFRCGGGDDSLKLASARSACSRSTPLLAIQGPGSPSLS